MELRKRLSAEVRKKQIREAAKSVFLKKGFENTSMEDVIKESRMSKGGVYHYYSNTGIILYDLMKDGNENRYKSIEKFVYNNQDMPIEEQIIEVIVMKMIDENEYKSLYAMFLMQAEKNEVLKKLKEEIINESRKEFFDFIDKENLNSLRILFSDEWIAFMNSIIVATEVLDVRQTFLNNKQMFKNIVKQYLQVQR